MQKYNSNNNSIFYEKVNKNLKKILSFCLIVTHYQYKYSSEYKNKLNILKILNKNNSNKKDLSSSAVFVLFSEIIKKNKNISLLSKEKLEQLALSQYVTVVEHFNKKEIVENFFENKKLKNKIDIYLYNYSQQKKFFEDRNTLILSKENNENNINNNYNYKKEILNLIPKYEKDLMKHSNNLLEKNIKYKNSYKYLKKRSFSWLGFWSDKKLFYEDNEKLKQKIINHYSKNYMKIFLTPILDISYYLPDFSGFNPKTLFNTEYPPYTTPLDVDKILKNSEQGKNKATNDIPLKNDKKENYLRDIYIKSNPDLEKSFNKIANHLDFGKEEEIFYIENSTEKKIKKKKYFLCCLIKPSHHIKGVVFITEKKLEFKVFLNQKTGNVMSDVEIGFTNKDDDYDDDRKTCFGSFFICHPKDKDLYKISIKYDDINLFFRRRYYYKNSGLEIFTNANKSFYFNFKYEEDRETTINELLLKLKDCTKIVNDIKNQKDIFDNVIGFNNDINLRVKKIKKIKISKKIEAWKEWQLSNYDLIMLLNVYSNRSYNDLTQYPVFPWLITDYEELNEEKGEEVYRDLSTPIGMLTLNEEGITRKELFLINFENSKTGGMSLWPFMFGSNYSNPTYVCNYLVRIFPYTHISIELQGNGFDDPNRLFNSVESSFNSACTHKSDVHELIPEFFCFPEMFLNINDLNMSNTEDGKKVNDVSVPCGNNPYEFTSLLRIILENDIVSNNINKWIDLIFGYKNKGEEAERSLNVFTGSSYQEDIDLKKVENKDLYLRYAEFGLIPNQLTNKEFDKRLKREDILKGFEIINSQANLKHFDITNPNNENINTERNILLAKIFTEGKISILFGDFEFVEKKINFSIFDKIYASEIINNIKLIDEENKDTNNITSIISEFYLEEKTNNKCLKFFNQGKNLILGGFYDGKIVLISLTKDNKNNKVLYPFLEEKPILAIEIDVEEKYLFLGNTIGNIIIYELNQNINKWKKIYLKTYHYFPIIHICCNNILNLWCSTSVNGYINLYTLPLSKLIRSIKLETKKMFI